MILDGLLTFTGTSQGATGGISSGAQTDLPTTGTQDASNIIDLGVTLGIPTSANGGGARDMGIGDYPAMKLSAIVIAAFTTSSTIQVQLAGAPDDGTGHQGSYTVMWTQATAVTSAAAGFQLCNVDLPRVVFEQVLPRYLKMTFIGGGTTNSTGTIEANIVLDLDQQIIGTTGAMSGYPAGINVAN